MYQVYVSGKILREPPYYFDQLDSSLPKVHTQSLKRYLREKYNLTDKEYYNIVVHGNIDYEEHCVWCGKVTPFKSLCKGYQHFCNQSCITKWRLNRDNRLGKNPFQNREWIDQNRSKVAERQSQRMKDGTHHFCKEYNEFNASRSRYLKYGYSETNLYICDTNVEGFKKFGLSKYPNGRTTYKSNIVLSNHEILYTGSPEILVDIEFELKREFCSQDSELLPIELEPQFRVRVSELISTSTTKDKTDKPENIV